MQSSEGLAVVITSTIIPDDNGMHHPQKEIHGLYRRARPGGTATQEEEMRNHKSSGLFEWRMSSSPFRETL